MSDRNPPTKPKTLAVGKIQDDLFSHVFTQVEDNLRRLGVLVMPGTLASLKGKKVRITISQERQ